MSYPTALLSIFVFLFLATASVTLYRTYRRRKLLQTLRTMPFPETWRAYLRRTVHYPELDRQAQAEIERAILRFVYTKTFIGSGLEVTEEMKAVIAFYACFMVRHRAGDGYPSLQAILLYADDFVVDELHEHGGIVSQGPSVLDGQSSHDTVVLSWPDAEAEAYHPSEYNVIIHEFAHILDFEDGYSDGVPPLPAAEETTWEHTLDHEFKALEKAVVHGHLSEKYQLLGDYAATDKAEFFAVASERFFMQPDALRHHFPDLYRHLAAFYG
jgi:MtfA peptidase